MHALLLLGTLLVQPAIQPLDVQPVLPESSVVSRPPALPSYRLAERARPQEGPFEYSDAYATRLKIHQVASFATVPLFVLQYIAGEQLIEDDGADGEGGGALADWHGGLAAGIAALYAVNTVTGGWNLLESRKDPENRTWRTIHGVLQLVAGAGFVATGVAANSADANDPGLHRTLGITSMGISLASYVMMLPPLRRE